MTEDDYPPNAIRPIRLNLSHIKRVLAGLALALWVNPVDSDGELTTSTTT